MRRTMPTLLCAFVMLLTSCRPQPVAPRKPAPATQPSSHVATATHGMVVTNHPIATDSAVAVLRRGGNAVDAAVAAALMLGVVDGHNSGIGGGCFMLIRTASGEIIALDGREVAPAAATRDMFIRNGKPDTHLSQTGPLAVGIPGSLAVYDEAIKRYGKKSLADLLAPAAKVAEDGFAIDRPYAKKLLETSRDIAKFPETARILLKPNGLPLREGDLLRQRDLARSYRQIAEQGVDWFYHREFCATVAAWMYQNGGIVTTKDFENYRFATREALETPYRGYIIVGFPPPSSGGLHVAQILTMLERFDVREMERTDPAKRVHVTAEAMKLAFADRAFWLGDPAFAKVPRGLLDADYLARRAATIDPDHVTSVEKAGTPPRVDDDVFSNGPAPSRHTTHIAAADAEGNWVAITTSVNTAFGSKVIVPGTGIILNNHMDDFSVQPGVPNSFKLVGTEANAIAPGKRPLSSMSPTILLDQSGRPVMTVGAAGGPTIISQVVLAISNHLELGDDLEHALSRPRFHHQWKPDTLRIENTFPPDVLTRLRAMGHTLEAIEPAGATQGIVYDRRGGRFTGVSEPRGEGSAGGF